MADKETYEPSPANRYTAKMTHTAETVKKMSVMQYNTFNLGRKILQIFFSAAMIIFGILAGSGAPLAVAALAVGCFMIVSLNHRPNQTANAVIRQFKGKLPSLHYFFTDSGISTNQVREETPFGDIARLVEDKLYLYIFLSSGAAYMIDSETVKGQRETEGFKDFIAEKTGQKWTKPVSLLNLNINTIMQMRKLREDNTVYPGERLSDRHR